MKFGVFWVLLQFKLESSMIALYIVSFYSSKQLVQVLVKIYYPSTEVNEALRFIKLSRLNFMEGEKYI